MQVRFVVRLIQNINEMVFFCCKEKRSSRTLREYESMIKKDTVPMSKRQCVIEVRCGLFRLPRDIISLCCQWMSLTDLYNGIHCCVEMYRLISHYMKTVQTQLVLTQDESLRYLHPCLRWSCRLRILVLDGMVSNRLIFQKLVNENQTTLRSITLSPVWHPYLNGIQHCSSLVHIKAHFPPKIIPFMTRPGSQFPLTLKHLEIRATGKVLRALLNRHTTTLHSLYLHFRLFAIHSWGLNAWPTVIGSLKALKKLKLHFTHLFAQMDWPRLPGEDVLWNWPEMEQIEICDDCPPRQGQIQLQWPRFQCPKLFRFCTNQNVEVSWLTLQDMFIGMPALHEMQIFDFRLPYQYFDFVRPHVATTHHCLRSLHLEASRSQDIEDVQTRFSLSGLIGRWEFPNLTDLTLKYASLPLNGFWKVLLRTFPKITQLSLSYIIFPKVPSDAARLSSTESGLLKYLELEGLDCEVEGFLLLSGRSVLSSLCHLCTTNSMTLHRYLFDLPHLRFLEFEICAGQGGSIFPFPSSASILKQCPLIQTIGFRYHEKLDLEYILLAKEVGLSITVQDRDHDELEWTPRDAKMRKQSSPLGQSRDL